MGMAQQMHEAALALTFTRVPRQGRCERKRQKKEKKKIPKADGPGPLDSELRLQRIDDTDDLIPLSPINDNQSRRTDARRLAGAKSKASSSMAHAEKTTLPTIPCSREAANAILSDVCEDDDITPTNKIRHLFLYVWAVRVYQSVSICAVVHASSIL